MNTNKKTHIRTYAQSWGMKLEVQLARLTETERRLLARRAIDALLRLNQKTAHLTVMLSKLTGRPLDKATLESYENTYRDVEE